MPIAVCTMSHSPLIGEIEPAGGVLGEIDAATDEIRKAIDDFDPEITIVFGPDHFNGVFYDMMPPFCIGSEAISVGDWSTQHRALPVDREHAARLVQAVFDAEIDVAQSERLYVDHGMTQTLEMLFGVDYERPIVPVFVNAVGLPLVPIRRVRKFGEAIGREAARWNKRVLIVGSGGLSHDPPVPKLEGAPEPVRERLIDGRHYTPEQREERQRRVIEAAREHIRTGSGQQPLNEEFDRLVMDTFTEGRLEQVDGWATDWMAREGGGSAHEIRAWVAAFAAVNAVDTPTVAGRWYWPVHEWGTGFGMMLTDPVGS